MSWPRARENSKAAARPGGARHDDNVSRRARGASAAARRAPSALVFVAAVASSVRVGHHRRPSFND
jgi:hypothetical protein